MRCNDFLATGFGPSNPALAHVLGDFLAQDENLVKGPYLSIALPPKLTPEGGEPFPEVPLSFTPYRHQRTAHHGWIRRRRTGALHHCCHRHGFRQDGVLPVAHSGSLPSPRR